MDENVLDQLTDLLTDFHFSIGCNIAAEIHARYQHKSPLYFYKFSYEGELNTFKKWFHFEQIKGASHGDELFYLFETAFIKDAPGNSRYDLMMKKMCRLWTNSAKYINPTPTTDDDKLINFKWNPVKFIDGNEENNKFVLDYLEINDTSKMEQDPDKNRVDFWREAFEKWNKSILKPKL